MIDHPQLRQTVLDTTDARSLADFYRVFLRLRYRPGDEMPREGPDRQAQQWLALHDEHGNPQLAFQPVPELPAPTWPDGPHPQMLHLDLTVRTTPELHHQRQRALDLGACQLLDRSDDPHEPLYVLTDPDGHPFCVFVAPGEPNDGH